MHIKRYFLFFLSLILCYFYLPSVAGKTILTTDAINSPPKFFVNDKGELDGLVMSIINEIEKINNQLEFIFRVPSSSIFVPLKRSIADIKNQEIDILFGLARTQSRIDQGLIFIDIPLYEVRNVIAVVKDDEISVNNMKEIEYLHNHNTVLTMAGSGMNDFLNKFELKSDDSGKSVEQNLQKLVRGRGRFFYYNAIGMNFEINRLGFSDRVKVLPGAFRTYKHYIALKKGTNESIISPLTDSLKALKENGRLKEIYLNYTTSLPSNQFIDDE